MIGPRIGLRVGSKVGAAVGIGADPITAPADAGTTMTAVLADSPATVINGKNFDITLVVTNTGTPDATTVSAAVTLDSNLTHVSSSGTGWSCNAVGQVVTCTRATMAAGAAPTITITVTAAQTVTVTASTSVAVTAANATEADDTETTQLNFIARDATSGIYFPASSTEWTNFIAYNGLSVAVPNSLYLCQEAGGNAADSIGSLTLTANATPLYQQTATGQTRKGFGFANTLAQRLTAGIGSGPDTATTSVTWLWFIEMNGNASTRVLFAAGTAPAALITDGTNHLAQCSVLTAVSGSSNTTLVDVQPFGLTYDRTGAAARLCTKQEKITGTYNVGATDGNKGIGDTGGVIKSFTGVAVYGCMWSGANGEISAANMKALYQAQGYSIAWS